MLKKTILIAILSILLFPVFSFGGITAFPNETLKFLISYKWGLIHKDAGEATLSLNHNGDYYNVRLAAKTLPWADRVFKVRDTLTAKIRAVDLKPISYTKVTHENGKHKRDEITYAHSGSTSTAKTKRIRYDKGKKTVKENTFTASGPAYDMLSVFYWLRRIDYGQLNKNKVYAATIFSGKQKETIKIRSLGLEKIRMKDKTEREAHHIRFNFTQDGGKKSSDDIDVWISTDGRHLPLYLTGKLPIGEIRAYLIGV